MKKLLIIAALFTSTLCNAQFFDTVNVHVISMAKLNQTTLNITVQWNIVDTNTNYLKRDSVPLPQALILQIHTFPITFYNVYGQNILLNAFDSTYVWTRKHY